MAQLPKFYSNDPKNKEEKLIVELVNDLDQNIEAFIRLNFDRKAPITNELFCIIRDGVINFSARIIRDLISVLEPEQHKEFINECIQIFIKQIETEISKK